MPTQEKDQTVREAVLQTQYTAKYIRDLLYADRIPGAHKVGREWRIPANAIEQLRKRKQA
jgi:hypothetical protein